MSILDDAIREHLELKRAHGADESELKKLEDEAFGPPGRPDEPDPFAEAPTEFMAAPEAPAAEPASEKDGRRRINVADLQEPPASAEEPQVGAVEAIEPPTDETAPPAPAEDPAQAAPPAEEQPALEHEIVAPPVEQHEEPEPAADERHAIAEQPTELFDVEAEMGTEDAPAAEAPSPSDEQIVEAELEEPKLVPVEQPEEDYEEEDEEFWSEQRLSDELDQALEAPITEEHEAPVPTAEPASPIFDVEEEEDEEHEEEDRPDYDPDTGHEDVLEDTPDFLEDAPEDDDLWFEQRPPKDFDFDD
ncbi:MAG: hypothetical protein ACTHNP_10430 [Solirubrobacterales bacterium]